MQIWREHVNAGGGILGRPVELVVYDDQSNGATAPGIYTKLLDVDKVDLLLSPYGTNISAPIMPLMKQRNRLVFGMLVTGINTKLGHDRFFAMGPWGPDPKLSYRGFIDLGHEQGFKTLAILAADAEFQQNVAEGGRSLAPAIVKQTIQKIRELRDGKALTVLMAEQNFHQAISIADRAYVIAQGHIVLTSDDMSQLAKDQAVQDIYLGT
jgi:ABC-type branched-subunit amino acid transport system substrate-binding protein